MSEPPGILLIEMDIWRSAFDGRLHLITSYGREYAQMMSRNLNLVDILKFIGIFTDCYLDNIKWTLTISVFLLSFFCSFVKAPWTIFYKYLTKSFKHHHILVIFFNLFCRHIYKCFWWWKKFILLLTKNWFPTSDQWFNVTCKIILCGNT